MRLNKLFSRNLIVVLGLVLVMQASQAWIIPALAVAGRYLAAPITNTVIWLGRAAIANPTMAQALEWSIAINGSILGALWFGTSTQVPTSVIDAKIVVAPNVDQPTVNPDPKKFDDAPASGGDPLQPAPKATFTAGDGSTAAPGTVQAIAATVGHAGETVWFQQNASTDLQYMVVRAPDWTYNGNPITNDCAAPAASWTTPAGYTQGQLGCWNMQTGMSPPGNYALYPRTKARDCSASPGYTLSNGNCVLTNAAAVTKPAATVPCEVTRKSDGSWYVDPKNPECASLASAMSTSADGKKITLNNGAGKSATITDNADGTRDYDIQDGTAWRKIKTGSYDSGQKGRPIISTTDGTGTNPDGTATAPGTGTGSGTGTGTTTGSCGGAGQPACSMDDSGFDGKATDGDGLTGKVDAHDQTIKDKLTGTNGTDKHGMDWTWIPTIPRVACTPYEFGANGHYTSIDLCSTFSVIRQALGWLLYIFMAWGLFDLLLSGTTTKGKK